MLWRKNSDMRWWPMKASTQLSRKNVKLSILSNYSRTRHTQRSTRKRINQSNDWEWSSMLWRTYKDYFTTSVRWSITCRSKTKSTNRIFPWWAYKKTTVKIQSKPKRKTAYFNWTKSVSVAADIQHRHSVPSKWHVWPTILPPSKSIPRSTSGKNYSNSQQTCSTTSKNASKQMSQSREKASSIVEPFNKPSKSLTMRPLRNPKKCRRSTAKKTKQPPRNQQPTSSGRPRSTSASTTATPTLSASTKQRPNPRTRLLLTKKWWTFLLLLPN